MQVAVIGLWHLGSVTAACAVDAGHVVVGHDPDAAILEGLRQGRAPVAEPHLDDLLARGLASGRLSFDADVCRAVGGAEVVWVCADTPVDGDDRADVESVVRLTESTFPALADGAVVLISSQVPVGTVKRLEQRWLPVSGARQVSFACSPENLRLGKAIDAFMQPDRVLVGVRDLRARAILTALFAAISDKLEWMSVESAEMSKHAINAFLATSVTFINELATLCERTGADAREVERGLKTERRIGPLAYLSPGGAVAGGTLARDVMFLRSIGAAVDRPTSLLDGVVASNTSHRQWARRRLVQEVGEDLNGVPVAIWGLTYKPGTDTLRRSEAVELCRWLLGRGAHVRVHDPVVKALADDIPGVDRRSHPVDAARGAAALVVATEWPVYRGVEVDALAAAMPSGLVLDANRFLRTTLGGDHRFRLISVGQPTS
jgi:UDPglucose 6-dehydrogenase